MRVDSGLDGGSGGPLTGITVIALEHFISGPYGSMLLADFGATVIKVEPPSGDTYRRAEPIIRNEFGEMTPSFLRVNRNKESVVLDLSDEGGRAAFLKLVETADIVWENLSPGAIDRLGIGWSKLQAANARLILASLSGFGKDLLPGPKSDLPAFDIVAQALSGHMVQVGEPGQRPLYLGAPFADIASGMLAVTGVLLALRDRDRTGIGQRVDVSMLDTMVAFNEQAIGFLDRFGTPPTRGRSPTSAPYDSYRCADGWIVIGVASTEIFARLCNVIDRQDLRARDDMATGVSRSLNAESLTTAIEGWTRERTVQVVLNELSAARVPAALVQGVSDLFEDPHVAARNMILHIDDPVAGPTRVAGNPIKLERHLETPTRPAPQLGANQERLSDTHGES